MKKEGERRRAEEKKGNGKGIQYQKERVKSKATTNNRKHIYVQLA